MKQSKAASLIESIVNIAVGFGLSCALQAIVLPALGVPMPWSVNLIFAMIMTAVSLARSFVLRRVFEALHIRRPLTPAMLAVIAERYGQVDRDGWTPEHDDTLTKGELATCGSVYARWAGARLYSNPPPDWPRDADRWNPKDFRRDLVRAAAFIIAEIERFDRRLKSGKKVAA